MPRSPTTGSELRGGIESTLHGISTSIGPVLLFGGFLGAASIAPAYWAAVVTATAVPAAALLLKGRAALLPATRTASMSAYLALVLQMALASAGPGATGTLSAQQLLFGLGAGSLLFAAASGLILLAGALRLGAVFKLIPSPVSSGIANSTALLLLWLAITQLTHSGWSALASMAGLLLGLRFWIRAQRRFGPLRRLPAIVPALTVGMGLALLFDPIVPAAAATDSLNLHWLGIALWRELPQHRDLGRVLLLGMPGTVTLALIMILESSMAAGVMESRFGLRVNASRELLVLGGSNLLSALLGGVPCTASPVRCVTNWSAGGRGARAALVNLSLTGLLLLFLGRWLLALPPGVVASLFLIQAALMADPAFIGRMAEMVRSRRWGGKGTADLGFWITAIITLVGFLGNLIWACFLGLGLSCLIVLLRVSANLTARWAFLDQHRSHRVRSAAEGAWLDQHASQVGVLRLTGHLFFGNSTRLTQLIDELRRDTMAVVIDVSQVSDVDPSGLAALSWLLRALLERKIGVVLSGVTRSASAEMRQGLSVAPEVLQLIDLDRGLEWCEQQVLAAGGPVTTATLVEPLRNGLLQGLENEELAAVLALSEARSVSQGEALFRRGDRADGIWMLEQGAVSILTGGADSVRLATFGAGQFVGEMGFIDGKTRSATVLADGPVRALLLSEQALAALARQQPASALKITRNIARELSLRVRNASSLLSHHQLASAPGQPAGTLKA